MYAMVDILFSDWLQEVMDEKGWNQSELARYMGVSRQAVSDVLNQKRNPGGDFARKLAWALHIPPEDVFRMAGILPAQNADRVEQLAERIASLDEEDQDLLDAFIDRMLLRKGKRASQSASKPAPGSAPAPID